MSGSPDAAGSPPLVTARDGDEARAAVARQGYAYVRVSGASMEPTLVEGDILRLEPAGAPAVGDVVTYADPGGLLVTHRVVGLAEDGLVCRGDARAAADPPVPRTAVVGRVAVVCGRKAAVGGCAVRARIALGRLRSRVAAAARRVSRRGGQRA